MAVWPSEISGAPSDTPSNICNVRHLPSSVKCGSSRASDCPGGAPATGRLARTRCEDTAFTRISAYSSAGSDSAVIAPPTPNRAAVGGGHHRADDDAEVGRADQREVAERARVDPARPGLEPVDDLHRAHLRRPGHRPRREAAARTRRPGRARGAAGPRTVETSWCTGRVGLDPEQVAARATDPISQTRPRSLRTRSTIIRFSARSFSLPASAVAQRARPRAGVAPRGPGALDRPGLDAAVRGRCAGTAPARQLITDTPENCSRAACGTGLIRRSVR